MRKATRRTFASAETIHVVLEGLCGEEIRERTLSVIFRLIKMLNTLNAKEAVAPPPRSPLEVPLKDIRDALTRRRYRACLRSRAASPGGARLALHGGGATRRVALLPEDTRDSASWAREDGTRGDGKVARKYNTFIRLQSIGFVS